MTRTCIHCAAPISKRCKSGRCVRCAARNPETIAKKCKMTPERLAKLAAISRQIAKDPAVIAKREASRLATMSDPKRKQRHIEGCIAGKRRQKADPAKAERMREAGKRLAADNAASGRTPVIRAQAAATSSARKNAWCPTEYRALNDRLKAQAIRLPDRKRMIADQAASDERARRRALTPFERQLERVAAGAGLIEMPTYRRAEPDFTIGGVASGSL